MKEVTYGVYSNKALQNALAATLALKIKRIHDLNVYINNVVTFHARYFTCINIDLLNSYRVPHNPCLISCYQRKVTKKKRKKKENTLSTKKVRK